MGSILPIAAIIVPPAGLRVPVTFVVVLLALAFTGALSAYLDGARSGGGPPSGRGALAMVVTYGIGQLVGVAGI